MSEEIVPPPTETRQKYLDMFTVDEHGVIRSPGKFEGEMIYVPYFYDQSLDGGGDILSCSECHSFHAERFTVWASECEDFPELEGIEYITLIEDSSGFVFIGSWPESDFECTCQDEESEDA